MPREKVVEASAINIKVHNSDISKTNSKKVYIDLINALFKAQKAVKIYGSDYGIVGWIIPLFSHRPEKGFRGVFYRFLDIDPDEPWLDLKNRKPIDGTDEDEPPVVPDHLKPNLREIPFLFYPESHRLYFVIRNMAPNSAYRFLSNLIKENDIESDFGEITLDIETSFEGIQRILAIHKIKVIEYMISRPNPDELGDDFNRKVFEEMRGQGVVHDHRILRAHKEGNVIPNDYTRSVLTVAKSNGWVWASGYKYDGKKVEEATYDHPIKEKMYYNPKATDMWATLSSVANKIANLINHR